MIQDTSRSYHIWRPNEGFAIIQLGYDQAGRGYFLHVRGFEGLMDKQIGFHANIDYHDHLGSEIILQYIDTDFSLDKLKKETDGVIINIIEWKNIDDVALSLGRWKVAKWGVDKLGHSLEVVTIHFKDMDDILPYEYEVKDFIDGIKWYK